MGKLAHRFVERVKEPGVYGDGDCLQLRVSNAGGKSWELRVVIQGRRRTLGLGSLKCVSLAEARHDARELRRIARRGGDPDTERKIKLVENNLTFKVAATEFHKGLAPTLAPKHAKNWLRQIEIHVFPKLSNRPIQTLSSADILAVLEPIWSSEYETAKRIRQRLERIFDWARGAGHYIGDNPVAGIKAALPKPRPNVQQRKAMPWQDVPAFMRRLKSRDSMASLTLQFIIHTGARSLEARSARRQDFDLELGIWRLPSHLAKTEAREVILTPAVIDIICQTYGSHSELIFPSIQGNMQSSAVFNKIKQSAKMGDYDIHGFRSCLRTWVAEQTQTPREIAEAMLGHKVGNETELAYLRTNYLNRRRPVNEAWSLYVEDRLDAANEVRNRAAVDAASSPNYDGRL